MLPLQHACVLLSYANLKHVCVVILEFIRYYADFKVVLLIQSHVTIFIDRIHEVCTYTQELTRLMFSHLFCTYGKSSILLFLHEYLNCVLKQ